MKSIGSALLLIRQTISWCQRSEHQFSITLPSLQCTVSKLWWSL